MRIYIKPAVHTIPQKPKRHRQLSSPQRACCPHYPPKTGIRNRRDLTSVTACCPHYPPKTPVRRLDEFFAFAACCPHYPQKLGVAYYKNSSVNGPAVHTIPQKPFPFPLQIFTRQSLLSTLSPKNQTRHHAS